MDGPRSENAALPKEGEVGSALTLEEWFLVDRSSGDAPLQILVPDPKQPRQWIDEEALLKLQESIRAAGEIHEPIVVTPIQCAPWVALEGVDVRAAFFVI